MANIVKNCDNPEETRKPVDNVEANIVDLGVGKAAKEGPMSPVVRFLMKLTYCRHMGTSTPNISVSFDLNAASASGLKFDRPILCRIIFSTGSTGDN